MFNITKNYEKTYVNKIYVKDITKNNRIYKRYYKILYDITILSGYINYKSIGEIVLYDKPTNIYLNKFLIYNNNDFL